MKNFKKLLALILAGVMSLSLFACAGDEPELKLNPAEDVEQKVDGNLPMDTLTGRIEPRLTFNQDNDYESWKKQLKSKLIEVLGINNIEKNACPLNVTIKSTTSVKVSEQPWMGVDHTRIEFTFNSEYGATVPAFLLIPDDGEETHPLAITLHGHSRQGYLSSTGQWLEVGTPQGTIDYAKGSGAYAIQAIERGYVALAIEQRGMATRMSDLDKKKRDLDNENGGSLDCVCDWSAYNALLLGRTIIGERVWEVSKAIDALSDSVLKDAVSKIDLEDITITGNSGGGTASFYAGCYDERIKVVAPSCGFCTYEDSLLYTPNAYVPCSCNYIPNAYTWFEMQDLSALIAPRKLAIVAGATDLGFPDYGVQSGFETIEKIYEKAGAKDNCSLLIGNYGHYWSEQDVWGEIELIRGV